MADYEQVSNGKSPVFKKPMNKLTFYFLLLLGGIFNTVIVLIMSLTIAVVLSNRSFRRLEEAQQLEKRVQKDIAEFDHDTKELEKRLKKVGIDLGKHKKNQVEELDRSR